MKTIAVLFLAVALTACASKPAKQKTAAELQCEYEAKRAMAGRFSANMFETLELYRACLVAKNAAGAQ